jgi:hypothetical protein
MRTTLNIDDPLLRELKRLQKRERKSMSRLVSDLLAAALARLNETPPATAFSWISKPMGARVGLSNHKALFDAMDEAPPRSKGPKR